MDGFEGGREEVEVGLRWRRIGPGVDIEKSSRVSE